MKKPYAIRTDFADEEMYIHKKNKTYEHSEQSNEYIRRHCIDVLDKNNDLGKDVGTYVSIECQKMDDQVGRVKMIEAICESLTTMCTEMKLEMNRILVVGLGNRYITSDALGPNVADDILVTSHLYALQDHSTLTGTRNVAVLQPGVMGQTGLETSVIVKAVAQSYHPDLIIVVDALATRNMKRINRVVQINNTGIQPGSGVGNYREPLNAKTMQVPLIAIGVATVTSVGAIIKQTMEDIGALDEQIMDRLNQLKHLDLIVTPKAMDDELKHLVFVVSQSLNYFLHPSYETL